MIYIEEQQSQREGWRNEGGRIKLAFRSRRLVEQIGAAEVDLNIERNARAGRDFFAAPHDRCPPYMSQSPTFLANLTTSLIMNDAALAAVAWR